MQSFETTENDAFVSYFCIPTSAYKNDQLYRIYKYVVLRLILRACYFVGELNCLESCSLVHGDQNSNAESKLKRLLQNLYIYKGHASLHVRVSIDNESLLLLRQASFRRRKTLDQRHYELGSFFVLASYQNQGPWRCMFIFVCCRTVTGRN